MDSEKRIFVTNPANGETVGSVPASSRAQAREAVTAATAAFGIWSGMTPLQRARILEKTAALIRNSGEYLAELLTREHGKPLSDSRKEITGAADTFEYYARAATDNAGEIACPASASTKSLVFYEPVGVVATITPWNYPVSLVAWKIAPALAAGCTVLVKPPRVTPLAAFEFIRICSEAGFPAGALNVLCGTHEDVVDEFLENPSVKKIAFTGSTETGKSLIAASAHTIKKLNLELGGHSPLIVFADADFDKAVKDGVKRSFRNMGQICNAVNRIYVHRNLYERYVEAFVAETRKMTIGDGLTNPNIDLGPMVDERGIDTTKAHIADAVAKGARVLCGGKKPEGKQYEKGYYFEPTVLVNVTADMRIMHEETFGPVVPIDVFDTFDEAIEKANSTQYGLVSYLYTSDLATAFRAGERIDSGSVAVNTVSPDSLYAPYGGRKQSGFGTELSKHGMAQYLQFKHLRIELP